jgi:hypothetical protein
VLDGLDRPRRPPAPAPDIPRLGAAGGEWRSHPRMSAEKSSPTKSRKLGLYTPERSYNDFKNSVLYPPKIPSNSGKTRPYHLTVFRIWSIRQRLERRSLFFSIRMAIIDAPHAADRVPQRPLCVVRIDAGLGHQFCARCKSWLVQRGRIALSSTLSPSTIAATLAASRAIGGRNSLTRRHAWASSGRHCRHRQTGWIEPTGRLPHQGRSGPRV